MTKENQKNIFNSALKLIKATNGMYDGLYGAGIELMLDGESRTAKTMQALLNEPKNIACDAMGLTLTEERVTYPGSTASFWMDAYYPEDKDDMFSISFEGMMDLLDKASEDEETAKNIWQCFAEKDWAAKDWLIENCHVCGFAEKTDEVEEER